MNSNKGKGDALESRNNGGLKLIDQIKLKLKYPKDSFEKYSKGNSQTLMRYSLVSGQVVKLQKPILFETVNCLHYRFGKIF